MQIHIKGIIGLRTYFLLLVGKSFHLLLYNIKLPCLISLLFNFLFSFCFKTNFHFLIIYYNIFFPSIAYIVFLQYPHLCTSKPSWNMARKEWVINKQTTFFSLNTTEVLRSWKRAIHWSQAYIRNIHRVI